MKYVASSISQMTDYDKYYVYTGHEEGMITGCWYFWSGTEWLIGGDYQCGIDDIIETSSTMDEEGMPADAKAVGDMIVVSDTEPTSPHTELWIDPDTESVLVPTMDDIEGKYAKKSEVESTYARKAAVGSPLRAATASAMTDVTKIYVYTGSESGYTSGHWYYYDGSSWADGGVYNSTAFVTDKTLTGYGEAADAKVTGDEITDLKSALGETETTTATPVSDAHTNINASGKIVAVGDSDDMRMYYAQIVQGRTYKVTCSGTQLICGFFNSIPAVDDVSYNASRTFENTTEFTAPISGYICFRSAYTNTTEAIVFVTARDQISREGVSTLSSRTQALENEVDDITYYTQIENGTERLDVTGVTKTSGYVGTDGTVYSNATYFYTSHISVQEGDRIQPYISIYSNSRPIRFVCAYSNGVAVPSKGSSSQLNNAYTVPAGVTSVVLSCHSTNQENMQFYINRPITLTFDDIVQNKNQWSLRTEEGSLASGVSMTISGTGVLYNKKNCAYNFWCNLSSFDSIEIGHGRDVLGSSFVKIDGTYLYAYQWNGSSNKEMGKYAHGLTIADFIGVNIRVDNTSTPQAQVTIVTSGGTRFVQEDVPFVGCRGAIYATPTMAITNAVLSYSAFDMKSDIFIFGDSYISLNDINRWPYHAMSAGYSDYMLCGYPGANSTAILPAFYEVINLARPKYVVWALGMNDADEENTYNADWKTALDSVMALCETVHATLILATIPNVPSVSNYYKNSYVVSSGYRYIDFARAVGAEALGSTWYDGMLSSDHVHPTQMGARALAIRAMADLPELS